MRFGFDPFRSRHADRPYFAHAAKSLARKEFCLLSPAVGQVRLQEFGRGDLA